MTNGRNRVSPAEAAAAMAGFPIRVTAFCVSYIFLRGFLASHPTDITSYVQKVGKQQSRYRRKSVTRTGGSKGRTASAVVSRDFTRKFGGRVVASFPLPLKFNIPQS